MSMPMTETRQADAARAPARDEERWQAVKRRDSAFDGKFLFAVRTTGIYCRPSCASRPAKRENVTFFETGAEAEKAGYPRLQALPARQARRARSANGGGQARVRTDRAGGGGAEACRARGERGLEPLSFPSRLQGHHGRDARKPMRLRRGRAAPPTSCARRRRSRKRSTTRASTLRAASTRTPTRGSA